MSKYELGKWDLTDLVANQNSPDFFKKIKALENKSKQFQKLRNDLSPNISEKKFLSIIHQIEDVTEKASTLGGYASLAYAADTQSDETTSLMLKISKLVSEIENHMLFFDLWWKKKIDERNAQRLMKSSGQIRNYLQYKRLMAKYSLSEAEEKIINVLDVTGITALVKLYDKITNAYEYIVKIDGKKRKLGREELITYVRNHKPKTREIAYKALLEKFQKNRGVLGEIYQNIVLNWKDEGVELRGFSSPISIRNIGNDVDDKTIQSLLNVCRKNSDVFQKYFEQKAKLLGMKKLRRYDIYAPVTKIKEKRYSYDKSVRLVFESFQKFSPKLAEFARRVFTEKHIDSSIRSGKRDGAFCSTISPKRTPYVLVNFTGKSRDVFTIAHELGHSVHSQSASGKSILVSEAPLPLAETASTFSELLLYDNLSDKVSIDEKKIMLSEKIDDLYATILRQAYFTLFEISAHEKIAQSTTNEEISTLYQGNLKEQFGTSVKISDDFSIEWCQIPHFYHTPFYCYAYSFGNLLALSLFQRYKKEGQSFVSTYLEILSAGGSEKPESLLHEHGFDISSEKFWQEGMDYVSDQVKSLKKIN